MSSGLFLSLGAILIVLLGHPAASTTGYCNQIVPPVPKCTLDIPRDVIFLLDASNSMDPDRFFGEMIDFVQASFCSFDQADPDTQAGVIVFAEEITAYVPLATYTQNAFYAQTEAIRATQNTTSPACCSCCTPTADAFDMAGQMFTTSGKNFVQIAFVVTDGVPSNNNAGTGGNPAWAYVDTETGFNPAEYNALTVATEAAKIKDAGGRVILLGVPNALGQPPALAYFTGLGAYSKPFNFKLDRQGKEWTYLYDLPPNPIVSEPVGENAFITLTWDVDQLLNLTIDALCRTSRPTQSPTLLPTALPSLSPSAPLFFDQVDTTYVIDRSTSMIWQDGFCASVIQDSPNVWRSEAKATSACWDLFLRYVLDQSDLLADIDTAGREQDRS